MTTDTISFKKELLLEQIENYQHSGYFTEKEIDRLCAPIMLELKMLECCEAHNNINSYADKAINSFDELKEKFLRLVNLNKKTIEEIEVIEPEILTPHKTHA